jgi:hypothetical protein
VAKEPTKGILIVALGHAYYGRMALNLALSLKFTSKLPIALAYNSSAITHISGHLDKFDKLIEVPEKYYTRKRNTEYVKAKTHIYSLSPFDETIFLDADTLWLPKKSIDLLFTELENENLVIQSRGSVQLDQENLNKKSFWCDLKEYREVYGGDKFYSLSSEFIYFKKNKENAKFFADAIKIYDNLKISHTMFAGGIPDELVFNISLLQNKITLTKDFYTPIYWEQAERKNMIPAQMHQQYFAYSVGGKMLSGTEKKFYDNLAKFYGTQFKVHHFEIKNKMSYLPERTHI